MNKIDADFIDAATNDKVETMLKLLRLGANVHVDSDYALQRCVKNRNACAVKCLLECGANVHIHDDYPLRWSAYKCHLELVVCLLEYGADVHACNDNALRLCIISQGLEIATTLLEWGADVHCDDDVILMRMQKNFDEEVANVIFPYCSSEDYHYFPDDYIKSKISVKSARKC